MATNKSGSVYYKAMGYHPCQVLLKVEERARLQEIANKENRALGRQLRHIILAYLRSRELQEAASNPELTLTS